MLRLFFQALCASEMKCFSHGLTMITNWHSTYLLLYESGFKWALNWTAILKYMVFVSASSCCTCPPSSSCGNCRDCYRYEGLRENACMKQTSSLVLLIFTSICGLLKESFDVEAKMLLQREEEIISRFLTNDNSICKQPSWCPVVGAAQKHTLKKKVALQLCLQPNA